TDGIATVTHTARDGSDAKTVEGIRVIGNAAPATLAGLMPDGPGKQLTDSYAQLAPSASLFALTLGLAKPPREFGVQHYSTQILPPDMLKLTDYARGARLMANEPGEMMPPMSVVDYAAVDA